MDHLNNDYLNNHVFLQNNDKGLIIVTFKASPDLMELLDRYALRHGLNRSEAIRKAIAEMVFNTSTSIPQKDRVERGIRL